MTKLLASMLLTFAALIAQAQPAPGGDEPVRQGQPTPDLERARIVLERSRLEAGFAAEDAVCYRKFLVNRCLDEVKIRRVEALADLRRQELSLNEQERKARAAAQILKTEEKSSPDKQQEAAEKRAEAQKDFDARLVRERQKNADRGVLISNEKSNVDAAAARANGHQEKAGARSSREAASAEEVKKFNERLEKARERQARHDREQASQTKPPASSLPLPR